MRNLSNWRSVRLWETDVERSLRQRHVLWLHGLCLGTITMLWMWAVSHLQMLAGVDSLALRYLVTLGAGYAAYLLLVRWWAAMLLGRDGSGADLLAEMPLPDIPQSAGAWRPNVPGAGGGGDFAGGGASADFADATAAVPDGVSKMAGGALEAAASSDEGAIVVVPVVAVFLIGCAIFFGAGALALLYFGWEVLLTVAVELAFSYAAARTAVRVTREGWASAALRLTWKPLAGAVCCAVLLGATIDWFMPSAHSLPQALRIIQAQR